MAVPGVVERPTTPPPPASLELEPGGTGEVVELLGRARADGPRAQADARGGGEGHERALHDLTFPTEHAQHHLLAPDRPDVDAAGDRVVGGNERLNHENAARAEYVTGEAEAAFLGAGLDEVEERVERHQDDGEATGRLGQLIGEVG